MTNDGNEVPMMGDLTPDEANRRAAILMARLCKTARRKFGFLPDVLLILSAGDMTIAQGNADAGNSLAMLDEAREVILRDMVDNN